MLRDQTAKRPALAGAAEAGAAAAAIAPDPALRMDSELGSVVLDFRDVQGRAAASIPTSRELDAHRQAAGTGAPRPSR
jgi:hypothetical protein